MRNKHWDLYSDVWKKVGPPLTPDEKDIEIYSENLKESTRTLVFGATPALRQIGHTSGIAVDNSINMIESLKENNDSRWSLVCGDWQVLPVKRNSIDQVVGDGCLTVIKFPYDHIIVLSELLRVCRTNANFVFRLFAKPYYPESLRNIKGSLRAGRIRNFHELKWRLAMCKDLAKFDSIKVSSILELFEINFRRDDVLDMTGWDKDVFDTIDIYKDSNAILSFPMISEIEKMMGYIFPGCKFTEFETEHSLHFMCPIIKVEI